MLTCDLQQVDYHFYYSQMFVHNKAPALPIILQTEALIFVIYFLFL